MNDYLTNRLLIDGNDVWLQYGVYIVQGGWNDLIAMPPMKDVESNDWHEYDGVEADLSAPVLNSREVSIKFAVSGVFSRFVAFMTMLSDGAYHDFNCVSIGRQYRLRLVSESSRNILRPLETTTLRFADDFPTRQLPQFEVQTRTAQNDIQPSVTTPPTTDYYLDGRPLTAYGAKVLQGSLAEVVKKPQVKKNLYRNIKSVGGAIYDGRDVRYQTKDIKLNILFRASSLTELWHNYDALLFNMTRPYEHVLLVTTSEECFYCSYKSCTVAEFYPDGQPWLKIRLTLTVYSRVTSDDIEEALGIIPPDDESEAARTVRQRVAASVTADNVVLPFQTQEEIDDSMLLSSEDGIIVFKDDDDSFAISIYPDRFNYPSLRLVNNRQTLCLTSDNLLRFNN